MRIGIIAHLTMDSVDQCPTGYNAVWFIDLLAIISTDEGIDIQKNNVTRKQRQR